MANKMTLKLNTSSSAVGNNAQDPNPTPTQTASTPTTLKLNMGIRRASQASVAGCKAGSPAAGPVAGAMAAPPPPPSPALSRKNTAKSQGSTPSKAGTKTAGANPKKRARDSIDDEAKTTKASPASNKKAKLGKIKLGGGGGTAAQPKQQQKQQKKQQQKQQSQNLQRKGSTIKLNKSLSTSLNLSKNQIQDANQPENPQTPQTATQTTRLKMKVKGKPPSRPLGVGYDSESSSAEDDPAIEENFILRLLPGEDADYLRQSIDEKKIGIPASQGGANVSLRFFSRDARRAAVRVQDRYYAAVMVDLPCIVESMKSFDRKGFWKCADISQMLLVTQKVDNEDDAKNVPIPKEVDGRTWQYPHGLTPPMHDVRRRRFRKRVSHRTIERVEEEVDRLIQMDEYARTHGGGTKFEITDWETIRRQEEGEEEESEESEEDEEESVEGGGDGQDEEMVNGEEEQELDDNWQAQFEAGLAEDDDAADEVDDSIMTNGTTVVPSGDGAEPATPAVNGISTAPTDITPTSTTPAPTHPHSPTKAQAIESEDQSIQQQSPTIPNGANEEQSSDEDEEDYDEDEEDYEEEEEEEEELTEEAKEKQQAILQQKEEIAHLENEIEDRKKKLATITNPLLKGQLLKTIKKFEEERDVKKRGLGVEDEE